MENIKQGLKRVTSGNKYISDIIIQPKPNNLDDLIDPKFRNVNRLYVFYFINGDNDPTRNFLVNVTVY